MRVSINALPVFNRGYESLGKDREKQFWAGMRGCTGQLTMRRIKISNMIVCKSGNSMAWSTLILNCVKCLVIENVWAASWQPDSEAESVALLFRWAAPCNCAEITLFLSAIYNDLAGGRSWKEMIYARLFRRACCWEIFNSKVSRLSEEMRGWRWCAYL